MMVVKARTSSVDVLRNCLIAGVVLQVAAAFVMVAAWPGEMVAAESLLSRDEPLQSIETGSWLWMAIGASGVYAGALLVLVALIGFGVKLGREAARL